MKTRPRSCVCVLDPRRNIRTPIRISAGDAAATSKESTCTMSVVPTFAPSMTASAGTRSTKPPAEKPTAIRPVAVLLWRIAVTPRPARKARARVLSALPRMDRSFGPKVRCTPVCTMCMPQSSRAIEPDKVNERNGKDHSLRVSPRRRTRQKSPFQTGDYDLVGRTSKFRSERAPKALEWDRGGPALES